MNPDYATSEESLAGAIDWAINVVPSGAEIESINFGRRTVDARGYYWYAVTYQRWEVGSLKGPLMQDTERTTRIRKVAAAWAAQGGV